MGEAGAAGVAGVGVVGGTGGGRGRGRGGGKVARLFVASEPLDRVDAGASLGKKRAWDLLAKDQMISFDTHTGELRFKCLSASCESEIQHRLHRANARFQHMALIAIAAFHVFVLGLLSWRAAKHCCGGERDRISGRKRQ